jgi:5'-3' exonuclease
MIRRWVLIAAGLTLVIPAIFVGFLWFGCRVYVPEDMCAVLIRKMGDPLPEGQMVATISGQRGIQEHVLGPGRHFRNPIIWDWELKPLTVIPSGDPGTWEWVHSLNERQRELVRSGSFAFKGDYPKVGVVVRKVGKKRTTADVVVPRASGEEGILSELLTPGTYKLNPYIYEVELHPALVIPAGFVGVVTNMFGDAPSSPPVQAAVDDQVLASTKDMAAKGGVPPREMVSIVPPLARVGERGTLRDVLQPGVYFINPKLQKVTLIEIGFNEYSQSLDKELDDFRISFPSDTGYLIRVGVTVVWGIGPEHAAEIINEFGNVDGVLDKIIVPQLRSICRNIGSTYAARDFIQGEKRELFQRDMTLELQRVCRAKHIEVLLSLVREIEVQPLEHGQESADVTEDLKRTIQESHIAIENQLTKQKQRESATAKAQLEEVKKKVDIARETIRADTRVLVARIQAEGQKEAAQIDARASLDVATIQQQVAQLDARRTEILGKAGADVEQMKKEAEAQGYRLLVEALGSPEAYNLFTFAERFQPESIRMIFAGEGTFWTDLGNFQDVAAAQILREASAAQPPTPAIRPAPRTAN